MTEISNKRNLRWRKSKRTRRKQEKKGIGIANLFACKVCWRSNPRKYVEFRLSATAAMAFASNRSRIHCPECDTNLPQFRSVWDEEKEKWKGKHGYWVPVYLKPNYDIAMAVIARGEMKMIKEGVVPQDERLFVTEHDGRSLIVPDLIKEEEE